MYIHMANINNANHIKVDAMISEGKSHISQKHIAKDTDSM